MPARLSKTMRHVLLKMAVNQSQGITVNFLLEPLTTRERKVMRQLIRGKLRSRNVTGRYSPSCAHERSSLGGLATHS